MMRVLTLKGLEDMPTYQYACTNAECGNRFEQVQAFTDAAITDCPQCADRVRRVYGSVGVVFKGSGFYRTDSRDAKTSSGAPETSDSGSSDSSSTPAPSTTTKAETSTTSDASPAPQAAAAAAS
jgi:putative FmdB family regulatory protein